MNQEMIERELERRKRYMERMQKAFEQTLERQNIKIIEDGGYWIRLEYKEQKFTLISNTDWNSWNKHYQVTIEGKTLATRCRLELAIAKAKQFIEKKEVR